MNNFIRLLTYIKPYKGLAIINAISNIISAIFGLLGLLLISNVLKVLFDSGTKKVITPPKSDGFLDELIYDVEVYYTALIDNSDRSQALMVVCIMVLITFFLKNFFRYLAQYVLAPIRSNLVKDIRSELHQKILSLPVSYFNEKRKGDVITRMSSDVQEVEFSAISILELLIRDPFTILIAIGTMVFMSWKLTLFVFIFLPVSGFVVGQVGKSLKRKSGKGQEKIALLISLIEENIGGLKIIKAFNAESKVDAVFDKENQEWTRINNSIKRRHDLASPMSEFMGATIMVIILWYGGNLIFTNPSENMEPHDFFAYITIFSQVLSPVKSISAAYNKLQKGMASLERIVEVLDTPNPIQDKPNALSLSRFSNSIEFDKVNFAYDNHKKVLKNVSFKVSKGKMIALVGQSGSGKSTIADLIARYWDIHDGAIKLDNQNLKDYKLRDVREQMGIITQESILFNDTVYNNIALGVESTTLEEVVAAAKIANAHDFINELEEGYHTNIGDRGSKLSGGQRQRISIARAVLKNPPILIMDEATSALDTESERLVQEALEHLMEHRTSVVIAHRLSTIVKADLILVLNEGEIVEQGTHKELLGKKGYYSKLHHMQSIS